jgi:hypothetical protein
MSKLGDTLIISGIAIMIVTLFLAFQMYTTLPNQGPVNLLPSPSNITEANMAGVLTNNISIVIAGESYLIMKIVIFFLVATVGYKFAHLGIEANKAEKEAALIMKDQDEKGKTTANIY